MFYHRVEERIECSSRTAPVAEGEGRDWKSEEVPAVGD